LFLIEAQGGIEQQDEGNGACLDRSAMCAFVYPDPPQRVRKHHVDVLIGSRDSHHECGVCCGTDGRHGHASREWSRGTAREGTYALLSSATCFRELRDDKV
jgi:hypothetical protein